MFKYLRDLFGLYKDFADAKVWLGKRWFLSKTLWVNFIAIVASIVMSRYPQYAAIVTPEMQVLILAGINGFLRLITKQPLVTKADNIIDLRPNGGGVYEMPKQVAAPEQPKDTSTMGLDGKG